MTDEFSFELNGRISYKRARIFLSRALGDGSYGNVYTASIDELPCAAKILSSVFSMYDPRASKLVARFEQEYRFLSDLKHPNLVQLLGLAHEPRSACPILLMELTDESLTKFLKRQTCSLPLHVQVNLAHDITLALAYLHSNEIIHRNLSSNNVLVAGVRAKVTDYCMSKMADINPRMISIILSPENQPFMPPEIFLVDVSYSSKVDIFSAGVLTIQIITRKFPAPTKSRKIQEFAASPTGVIEVPVPERERRNNDIVQISPTHPLLPVAIDCLKDKHGDRPSAGQLCQRLAALKEAPPYAESTQRRVDSAAGTGNIGTCTSPEKEGKESDNLQGQPQQKCISLQETLRQLAEKNKAIQDKDDEIRAKNDEMRSKDEMIKAKNMEVQEKTQEVTQLQKSLKERNDEVAKLDEMVKEKQGTNIHSPQSIPSSKLPPEQNYKVRVITS